MDNQKPDKKQKPALKQASVRRSCKLLLPKNDMETLYWLIDGVLGSADDEDFIKFATRVKRKIEKVINCA